MSELVRSDRLVLQVPDLVLAWADKTPDAVAVSCGDDVLTFSGLAVGSAQMAAWLTAQGIGPGDCVVVALPRTTELITVLLAIWRAGAAYVPIDLSYPVERCRMILADSGAAIVVSDELNTDGPLGRPHVRVSELRTGRTGTVPRPSAEPCDLAYVIYTSGSTGQPKGVMVEHGNLADFVVADPRLDIQPGEVVGQLAPVSFDASMFEIWAALAHGAQVALLAAEHVSLETVGAFLRASEPDWLFLASGFFHLVAEHDLKALSHVGNLITGGDVLSPGQVTRAAAVVRRQLIAAYGPTEATVFASLYPVPADGVAGERVPIGSPPPGTALRVLDDDLSTLPIGEVGNLYISGPGVARGYLKRPDLTRIHFVPDPYAEAADVRMYRTGDRARQLDDGVFEFCGRLDRQVKIRGFRIELGEIEETAAAHPEVAAAAAEVFDDGPALKRIAVFVQTTDESKLRASDLRLWLEERLPPFMIPSGILMVDGFPLDPNGKLLRAGLPYPWLRRDDLGLTDLYAAPQNAVEQAIATAWADTLDLDRVGRDDNFFEIGGDSLRSVVLVARLAHEGIIVPGEALLDHQTVAELAASITLRAGSAGRAH